ncbi:hypothetical protein STRIP9103_04939 [Streptomyces ipomoeae 91-03]|uniref:Uncharacterized protein n=2 Tax=Streptomyces ipomoeae TaxID=103232 RepID=L1KTI4_9ACTN|nr:hypothetical protein STRIP9103_04939 [Streptomyces ipomoeae 91-03]
MRPGWGPSFPSSALLISQGVDGDPPRPALAEPRPTTVPSIGDEKIEETEKGTHLMLWPALRVLSQGELTSDQLQRLLDTLRLARVPRSEGPGAAKSVAHRSFIDSTGTRLVLDLATAGESGWVLALFFEGEPPATETVEGHRVLLREAVERFGLTLIEITPAATADEVHVVPPAPGVPESGIGAAWDLPYDNLDDMWPHLGLRKDAPREVKKVKLREVMRTPAWSAAPAALRREAEDFLADG